VISGGWAKIDPISTNGITKNKSIAVFFISFSMPPSDLKK
jgi:hypothetical protein